MKLSDKPLSGLMDCPIAGSWYPADPEVLRESIEHLRPQPKPPPLGDVCGILAPHAGHAFSGKVAMEAYSRLSPERVERVIILAPSHYAAISDRIQIPEAVGFRTPLGTIEADTALLEALGQFSSVDYNRSVFKREHSFWIHLPLLQVVLGERFRLVPLIFGRMRPGTLSSFACGLRERLDERTLLIASSDFTHYGERFGYVPFVSDVPERIRELDKRVADRILAKDVDGFNASLDETGATVCGRYPIESWLRLLPDAAEIEPVSYDTSGRQTGDWSMSVSYCSLIARGEWNKPTAGKAGRRSRLDKSDREKLLKLARRTLRQTIVEQNVPTPSNALTEDALTPGLQMERGGFVTLHKHGSLRGCIGEIFPSRPIWRVVIDHAIDAALRDPRFPPVGPAELDDLQIEISVLSPPRRVTGIEQIEIGRHGIVLSKQGRQAVFLPRVAPEQGWTREETLTHLALKAGLSQDAWREDAELMVFEAEVFAESSEPA